jgi:hypothetical protein
MGNAIFKSATSCPKSQSFQVEDLESRVDLDSTDALTNLGYEIDSLSYRKLGFCLGPLFRTLPKQIMQSLTVNSN